MRRRPSTRVEETGVVATPAIARAACLARHDRRQALAGDGGDAAEAGALEERGEGERLQRLLEALDRQVCPKVAPSRGAAEEDLVHKVGVQFGLTPTYHEQVQTLYSSLGVPQKTDREIQKLLRNTRKRKLEIVERDTRSWLETTALQQDKRRPAHAHCLSLSASFSCSHAFAPINIYILCQVAIFGNAPDVTYKGRSWIMEVVRNDTHDGCFVHSHNCVISQYLSSRRAAPTSLTSVMWTNGRGELVAPCILFQS